MTSNPLLHPLDVRAIYNWEIRLTLFTHTSFGRRSHWIGIEFNSMCEGDSRSYVLTFSRSFGRRSLWRNMIPFKVRRRLTLLRSYLWGMIQWIEIGWWFSFIIVMGYHLLVFRKRENKTSIHKWVELPGVSIVIAVKNGSDRLIQHLDLFLTQDYHLY